MTSSIIGNFSLLPQGPVSSVHAIKPILKVEKTNFSPPYLSMYYDWPFGCHGIN